MCGLGASGACTFTPGRSGNVIITVEGYRVMNTGASIVNSGYGLEIILAYGPTVGGSGPAYLAAATGAGKSLPIFSRNISSANPIVLVSDSISQTLLVTGLSVGTQYWADVQIAGVNNASGTSGGSACGLANPSITVIELP